MKILQRDIDGGGSFDRYGDLGSVLLLLAIILLRIKLF